MAGSGAIMNPCNPLGYLLNRQIDSRVNHCKRLVDARISNAENLFRKDLYSHYGCVNAIEFSQEGDLLITGGDDKRVLLWQVERAIQEHGKPVVMKTQHNSNIFCLGYNTHKTKIFSAGNDDQVILHDLETTDALNFFRHEKPVYGISVHPHNANVFASACDDGRVLIYDIRGSANSPESFFCLAVHKNPFHSVMFNPVDSVMLATANAKDGVSMWDVRKPLKPVLRYGSERPAQSCMNVRFNEAGTTLLALRRRLPPVLYAVNSAAHLCQFYHPGYYNSCTMKSCCFAGDNDEYILSGSDDFNLYMWKVPTDDTETWVDSAHIILRGHRSIVNHARYNQAGCMLASSGVEKIIKLWSPFPLSQKCSGGLRREDDKEEKQRRVYTHDEYIGLVLRSGQFMTHDYSHQSTDEDQRMMAFFDSLVQREIESWSSEDIPTPQTPSEHENNNTTDRNNISDSDDSVDSSERHLLRCFLDTSILTRASPVERPLESPNRITRLIANRREKIMRLAALENGAQSKSNSSTTSSTTNNASGSTAAAANAGESGSASEQEANNGTARAAKSKANKMTIRSKGLKRKHSSRVSCRRNRARRKRNNAKDDSDTEPEEQCTKRQAQKDKNNYKHYQPVDATQPSTSKGVIATRRLRLTATSSLPAAPRQLALRSSSSSSEENSGAEKRRVAKSDSDSSAKELPKRKVSARNKSKISAAASQARRNTRVKGKRLKTANEAESNNHSARREPATASVQNGAGKETAATPVKGTRHAGNSDSGITSGVSTEKNHASTAEKAPSWRRARAGSSDRECMVKNLERFRKKVDVARRGYRKRVMLPSPSSSESSDD